MEILKNHPTSLKFAVPNDLSVATYRVFKEGAQIGPNRNAIINNGLATVEIPYAAVTQDGQIRVTLTFTYESVSHSQDKLVDVQTPYLDLYEVKEILETDNDLEAREAEAAARHIINAHCGQSFGQYIGELSITGSGENSLRMPRRLISFNTINNNSYWSEMLALRGNGWYLQTKTRSGPPSIRADYYGWHYQPGVGVISAPPVANYISFSKNVEFTINGVWGWESVPDRVREAAKLLINDYASGDSLYRDRFLTSMTAADWRIQFNEGAFHNTGNLRANQLLEEYVLQRGWVVI